VASYDYLFGTTRIRIRVGPHVAVPGAAPVPFVATAYVVDDLSPVTEHGVPVERCRKAEEQALEALCCWLETRFGSRRRLSPRPRFPNE
jgi:hypothetical protein